jgi:hypothetical protein
MRNGGPFDSATPQDRIVIVVKTVGREDLKVGSVSISQDLFLGSAEGRYTQWITLFDHLDDDEYDGDIGENDEESPRV